MFRKVRFYYLVSSTVLKKEWKKLFLVVLLLGGLSFFTFAFAPFIRSEVTKFSNKMVKPVYVEAVVGIPRTFNPIFSRNEVEKEINSLVFRGLMRVSAKGILEPDLAESYSIISPTEYKFELKKDIFWHDGTKLTARDVVHTVETAQNPIYESEIESNFREVEVEAVDDHTVFFRLQEPFAPFLTATTVGIIPAHIPLNKYKPVGTGTFRFIDISEEQVTLEGNRNKIKFRFYPNLDAAITAIRLGEAHGLSGVAAQYESLEEWRNFKIEEKTLPLRLVSVFFNLRDEIFSEKLVRQALAYAIPKEEIVKISDRVKGKVAINSFSLLDPLQETAEEKYIYNLEKANSNFTDSGWVKKEDGIRYKGNQRLEFSITTIEDPEFEHTALKLKEAWEKVGALITVNIVSGIELKNQIVPNRSFSVLLTSQLLSVDPDQYVLWHTTQTQGSNISGIASPKLDKLLEDGRKILDEKIRQEKYQEFTRLLLDEAPAIFLYYPNYRWLYSERIGKVNLESFLEPENRFISADSWEIKRPLW